MSEVNWSTKPAVGALIEGEHNDTTGTATGVWGYAYGTSTGEHIALQGECDDIALRLMRAADNADRADFSVDTDGYLHITPSGDRIRLWEHDAAATDYADLWVNNSGIINVRPNGTGATTTGILRLWDATGIGGDFVNLYSNVNGNLTINPAGLGTNITSINALVGSSMLVVSGEDTTAHGATDEDQIMGIRVNNNTGTTSVTGTQCGIHFNTTSAFAGVFGVRGSATNQQGLAFYTESGSRSVKFEIDHTGALSHMGTQIVDTSRNCDFNNVNADGSFQMDGSDIIDSSGNQTGVLRTRMVLQYGNSTTITASDFLKGVNGTDPGLNRLAYDCTLTAVSYANVGSITATGDYTCTVTIAVFDGDSDGSPTPADTSLVISSSDNGNYGKAATGLSTDFQAGDRLTVQMVIAGTTGGITLTMAQVTLYFLSE
jgi:hypothetical protein